MDLTHPVPAAGPTPHRPLAPAAAALVLAALGSGCQGASSDNASVAVILEPGSMPRAGTVDVRFQSYDIEMVEVTGGSFWRPYAATAADPSPPRRLLDVPPGRDPRAYQYRRPLDLDNSELRRLAAALGPSYVRVSGTWANSTYFADSDTSPSAPPAGFRNTLTRPQWQGVIEFARAVDAQIVTSVAISAGVRDASGVWTSGQARQLLDYTRRIGGHIAAVEFMNEPNLPVLGGAPEGYGAVAYERDFRLFSAFVKEAAPQSLVVAAAPPPDAPDGRPAALPQSQSSRTAEKLAAPEVGADVFSYHYYRTASQRCSGNSSAADDTTPLSERELSGTDAAFAVARNQRDQFAPGKPIWLTETAESACGGNPRAATFVDTFRYLDQLGRLAKAGVAVVMHNTLSASDYGLLDERTLNPRPNYWGAWLWRQLMGRTVLDAGAGSASGMPVYAHCQRSTSGGVTLLLINTDLQRPRVVRLPFAARRYTLSAAGALQSAQVRLNGAVLRLDRDGMLPQLTGAPTPAGVLRLDPATITFLAIPEARNPACREETASAPRPALQIEATPLRASIQVPAPSPAPAWRAE